MQKTFKLAGWLLSVLMATLFSSSADAGIKYWDNPAYKAFDVGDYVQSDLIWNYDGIRNVGATAAHDPNALTWANLGSFGSANDIVLQKYSSSWTAVSSTELGAGTYGEWTDKGFVFKGNSRFRRDSPGQISVTNNYTVQFLVDATSSGQAKSLGFLFSVQYDQFAMLVSRADGKLYWRNIMAYNAANNGHSLDSFLDGGTFDYGTAIVDGTAKTTALFSGTKAPTSGDGFRQYAEVYGRTEKGYVMGCTSGAGNEFTGTMKFLRVYNHALSEEEVVWNRVIDEARYFNRATPIPVTNVVVATAVPGAEGTEPVGNYAVDGRHLFTAPATVTAGGIEYVCTGYTLETRVGDGWSEPVFHKAALYQGASCNVPDSGCVRLTWQWAKAAGLANLGYGVSDYVWDGLEVFYDGICNQGTNVAHSYTATNWVNLGSVGVIDDVFVQRLKLDGSGWVDVPDLGTVGGNDPGYWTENGFTMKGTSRFRCNAPGNFTVGNNYSLQMLLDAKASDQVTENCYPLGANSDTFAFLLRKSDGSLFWKYQYSKSPPNWAYMTGGVYDYLTAIARDNNTQTFFDGTTEPTSGTGRWNNDSVGYSDTGFCLGGYGKTGVANRFVGIIKSFRQYDHALSAAEVAQNRKVDNWRYFGIPDNPNVVVQSTVPYLRGEEPDGSYAVDGGHTFTAPATVTAKGIDYACDGYTVETWDGSAWVNAVTNGYCSYTYTVDSSPSRVRLTWRWKATHGLRTAADYSFDDYSQAGLVWNYDGIRNRGYKDSDHYSGASTWKNLGSGGSAYDLSFKSGTTTTGAWADDGYIFRDGPRFWSGAAVGPIKSFTLQTLVDADITNQPNHTHSYIMSVKTDSFNMSLVSPTYSGSASNSICWTAQGGIMMYFHTKDLHYTYATAMMDFDAKTAMMFPDTTIPTAYEKYGPNGAQRLFHQYTSVSPVSDTGYGLGNANNANANGMKGKIKSFRYYDRVLTKEELARNRNADAARYFGQLGVTNLVVEVAEGDTYACDPAPGAYFVEGSWTFTAADNGEGAPTGCKIQVWDETAGTWGASQFLDGTSYEHTVSNPSTKVKITWRKNKPLVLVVR